MNAAKYWLCVLATMVGFFLVWVFAGGSTWEAPIMGGAAGGVFGFGSWAQARWPFMR